MKQAISYILLFLLLLSSGCSSKQDTKTSASVNGDKKSTEDPVNKAVKKDEITITTPDNVKLSANYFYDEDKKESKQPLVILIHQFRRNKEQWSESFIDSLVNSGYKVLAYDIRGHGESEKVSYPLTDLLTDPDKAPRDVDGVFEWAKKQEGIDTERIGAIGTSIGGNLACYAKYNWKAKTVISVSSSAQGFEKLLGIDPRSMSMRVMVRLKSVLFICGSKDDEHEKGEKYIIDNYIAEPMELKVYDTDKHGIYLIREFPEIRSFMLSWLRKYL
jgi:dienelactone hydrolase